MTKPYITALIDTYNQGHFIEEAIESVLAQDFQPSAVEIIVVDDGSTDDTPQRVRRFGNRIRYIYKDNGGQASALNAGFAAAQGEIVALLDGDDLWRPGKLSAVAAAFEADPAAIMVYHALQYWDSRTGEIHDHASFWPLQGNVLADRKSVLRFGDVTTSAMCMRRTLAARLLPIPANLRILADGYLGYLAIFLGPVGGIAQPLTVYRVHGENLCSFKQGNQAKLESRARSSAAVCDGLKRWLENNGFNLSDPLIADYVRRHELVAQRTAFTSRAPGRRELLQHLRDWNHLYSELWTPQYRIFRSALAPLSFLLGYSGFQYLEEHYRRVGLAALRERLVTAKIPAPPAGGTVARATGR